MQMSSEYKDKTFRCATIMHRDDKIDRSDNDKCSLVCCRFDDERNKIKAAISSLALDTSNEGQHFYGLLINSFVLITIQHRN